MSLSITKLNITYYRVIGMLSLENEQYTVLLLLYNFVDILLK